MNSAIFIQWIQDIRAGILVPNHLSFFIFNHVAIFERRYWPRQIVVNGSVLMEGKKMSKSLGNIIPLRAAIKEYGADSIRLAMLSSAEVLQDADFSFDGLRGIRSKLFDIYKLATQYSDPRILKNTTQTPKKTELEDRWLISRLERVTIDTTVLMDKLRVREALHNIFYLLDQDLNWYKRRIKSKGREDSSDVGSIMAAFIIPVSDCLHHSRLFYVKKFGRKYIHFRSHLPRDQLLFYLLAGL